MAPILAVTMLVAAGLAVAGIPRAAAASSTPQDTSERVLQPSQVTPSAEAPDDGALRLARAAMEQRLGNYHGVIAQLEPLDFTTPAFPKADRAAFLLGHAYLALGSRDHFLGLARVVARWSPRSRYTDWLRHQEHLAAAAAGDSTWVSDLPAPDPETRLGRDLAGAEAMRRATAALARGADASSLLESVPAGSRYAARARHMLGVSLMERGLIDQGAAVLESLLVADPGYASRREVHLALAGRALDRGRWNEAYDVYRKIDTDWVQHRDTLKGLVATADYESLWTSWATNPGLSEGIVLDAEATAKLAELMASATADLLSEPELPAPVFEIAPPAPAPMWPVLPPPRSDWLAVATSAQVLDEHQYHLARTQLDAERERQRLAAHRRYLTVGLDRAAREAAELDAHAALLDSLRRHLDILDSLLQSVRDTATSRMLSRTRAIIESGRLSLTWMHAMRHFHLEGPWVGRRSPPPPGLPAERDLLGQEDLLTTLILETAARIAAEVPGLIARSYAESWRPDLVGRAQALDAEARALRIWTRSLAAAMDSSRKAFATSAELAALESRAAGLARAVDSLRAGHQTLRARVARAAIERTLADLDAEREGIDYGLAASSYAQSVGLSASDSLAAAAPADTLDDPHAEAWRSASIAHMTAFLERHPASPARGEMRFHLADLLLVAARHRFRQQMEAYLRDQEAGQAASTLPVLTYDPALALYRKILAEDADFERRDAVLFNAGMILADGADPEAATLFRTLVTTHPESPYVQESWLRMGDLEFSEKHFSACVDLYEHAAAGPDTSLTAIARFKQGWAYFNEDRFLEAVDAFRVVLDLYASAGRAAIQADVEDEAETYLMHALSRAGGAEAFTAYFDRVGRRPYDLRLLLALGQHFRRYSMFAEAAAVDQLVLERHPLDPGALLAAERMIETQRRAERPDDARRAQLEHAAGFAPGGKWYEAQTSDSVRVAGATFARTSMLAVAKHHHRLAREKDVESDWRESRRLYEHVLRAWPDDAEAPSLRLFAAEAAAELGDPAEALVHYQAAAASGVDSIVALALWQRLAVTDSWYSRTRATGDTTRNDSLARAVLEAGDALLARYPEHAQAADVRWRQGNLAFAHGWFERAAEDFGRMALRDSSDKRLPIAARLRADAFFRLERFEDAGAAYERALATAQRAGVDSLARYASAAIPVCYFRHADAAVAKDSTAHEKHAALFERVAVRWPNYEHAHVAKYRAGLAWLAAGSRAAGIQALEELIRDFPRSEYVRDARLQIAHAWEKSGERERAAEAWAAFAASHPDDESAGEALLKSADLLEAAGLTGRADATRIAYIRLHPEDVEMAMEIYEKLARREVAALGTDKPISSLLPKPAPPAKKKAKTKPAAPDTTRPASHLAEYLRRAGLRPDLASKDLIAEVRFLQGDEARRAYVGARLTQPLDKSITVRQRLLDSLIAAYGRSAEVGVAKWAQASAFRIGEALIGFGEALEKSERPADLTGDDLIAYEDVLLGQADAFHARGEQVWTDLLRAQRDETAASEWVAKARESLWQRLARRFFYMPEAEHPLAAATPAERQRSPK